MAKFKKVRGLHSGKYGIMNSIDLVFQTDNDTCRVWKRATGLITRYLILAKYYDEAWVMMNTTTEYEVIDDSGILNDIPH